MRLRCGPLRWPLLLAGGVLATTAQPGLSQELVTLTVEENFRREPNGVVLARIGEGAQLRRLTSDGDWTQVEVEGWVWLESLRASDDPTYDLVVRQQGGENLRARPSGAIVGVLEEGALLEELGREPSWARVARVGWIWSRSLRDGNASVEVPPPARPVAETAAVPSARTPGNFARPPGGGAILAAPDGDTLGSLSPAGDVEVLSREGNWARVRLEGWMWAPAVAAPETPQPEGTAEEPEALAPAVLAASPRDYGGRVVAWTVQFISLERAEAVRTDFFEGEPFLLARFGGSDGPFVYIAIPTDRLSEVDGLVPLEELAVTGRIRTGASALTGAPIIDLIDIERSREEF